MRKLTLIILSLSLLVTALFASNRLVAFAATSPYSGSQKEECAGVSLGGANACDGSGASTLTNIIKVMLDILSAVVGVAAVIMIIVGGFRYVTSGGDSNSVSGAKNTIIYAIIGLVIAVLAQVLVQFVLAKTNCAQNPTASQCTSK